MLGVRSGVIALTKADLVDPELLDLVRLEVDEFVAGSFLENAPKVAVSSITGAGIADLRRELEAAARSAREKSAAGWFRLPIDRAFTMKGFGTVVTGTLISGTLDSDRDVEIYPAERRVRVRGVQVYGQSARRAKAGERTAVNLADIEPAEIQRGMVLSEPGLFAPVTRLDCRFDLLPSAKPLKNGAPVHFHAGTAEIEASVRWLDKRPALQPGGSVWARIILAEPALMLPGDRFIVRMFSPVSTIGGGIVVDITGHRYRKGEDAAARLQALTPELLVAEKPYGVSKAQLVAWTGLREIPASPRVEIVGEWLIAGARVAELREQLTAECRAFHREHSLLPGIRKPDLKAAVMRNAPPEIFEYILDSAKDIVREGEVVRLRSHRVVLKADEATARATIEGAFEAAGLAVPAVQEVLKTSGVDPARARTILQTLLREGNLVGISAELVLHSSALARLHALIATKRGQRFSVPVFKEWTGVSRKYAIPLLEFLDREHVTKRDGDERIVT
jgi:selenocysteine-specific elongation factor